MQRGAYSVLALPPWRAARAALSTGTLDVWGQPQSRVAPARTLSSPASRPAPPPCERCGGASS
eukprot:1739860-Prymnesium_polylepis.2